MGQPRKRTAAVQAANESQVTPGCETNASVGTASDNGELVQTIEIAMTESSAVPERREGVRYRHERNSSNNQPSDNADEGIRFSIKDFASLTATDAKIVLNRYARGQILRDPMVRALAYYGYMTGYAGNDTLLASTIHSQIVINYFEKQLTKATGEVSPMTEICAGGDGPTKVTRYYHVVWDLCDVIRERPKEYQCALTPYIFNVMWRIIDIDAKIDAEPIFDREGNKINAFPRARARLSDAADKFRKIIARHEGEVCPCLSWDEFGDFANKIKLFAPGFKPRSWTESVK